MFEDTTTRRGFLKLGSTAILGGLAGCGTAASDDIATTDSARSAAGAQAAPETESPYTQAYQATIDSVVLIRTTRGQGTGFVFESSTIVTNAHVVGQATTAEVRFNEGEWRTGDVVGTDVHSDLAVLSVSDAPQSATPLAFREGEATVGQEVVAIGNPFNLNGTVTTGVVSGIDRSIPAPTGFRIPDAIQTDASVNPGNSGGPLVSLNDRVVAVINSGRGDNIAFGISAALTQRVVPELLESGEYDHPYIGASFSNVTTDIAQANDIDEPRGLLVVAVADGAPAEGVLQPSPDRRTVDGSPVPVGGDVVVTIDGRELMTPEDLGSYLALQRRPGDTVELSVLRDGTEQTVELELGTRATQPPRTREGRGP